MVRRGRSEVTAPSVFAAYMTDTGWSFSQRSAPRFFYDGGTDDDNEENTGGANSSSRLPSSNSHTLQQIDLAAREDSAQYKPDPWSIAKINAAYRPRQPNAPVKSVQEKPPPKEPPRGAIVDAFTKQAQKPSTTNSTASAQANRRRTLLQKPALTSAIDAPDNPMPAPTRSPIPIAHITTSAVDPVPTLLQPRTPQPHQGTPLPIFLPRKAFPISHPSPNPHFTPSLQHVQPLSSPAPPPPPSQDCVASVFRPRQIPPQAPAYFEPRTLDPHSITPSKAPVVADCVNPVGQGNARLAHPSHPKYHPTPVKPTRTTTSLHPRQQIQHTQPYPRHSSNQPVVNISSKSEMITPSPSFAQARRFFEYPYSAPPEITSERPSPEPLEESHTTPPPPRLQITSFPRKHMDPYDQFPPSPDSEWSTLKPQTRKVNRKGKSNASDVKSGKFRLPLRFGSITPEEPPQKKARVITYLPPPPPNMQKTVVGPHPGTRDTGSGICVDGTLLVVFLLSHIRAFSLSRVALSTSLRRNGSAELTHTFRAIRFKWCAHPL